MIVLKKLFHQQKGQSMVEAALTLPIFFFVIFGMLQLFLSGISFFIAGEIALETARKYAVLEDKNATEDIQRLTKANKVTKVLCEHFVKNGTSGIKVNVNRQGNNAVSVVRLEPRVNKIYGFDLTKGQGTYVRTAECVMERQFRAWQFNNQWQGYRYN